MPNHHNPAYLLPEFLESDEARPIRILAEYFEPLRRFKAQNIQDTVVFFGSARVPSMEHAEAALEKLQRRAAKNAQKSGTANGKSNDTASAKNGKNGKNSKIGNGKNGKEAAFREAMKRARRAVDSARFY